MINFSLLVCENSSGFWAVPPPGEEDDLVPITRKSWGLTHFDRAGKESDWLTGFLAAVAMDPDVPKRELGYYAGWAKDFRSFCLLNGLTHSATDSMKRYVSNLSGAGRSVFLVKQAEKAIRILLKMGGDERAGDGLAGPDRGTEGRDRLLPDSGGKEAWDELRKRLAGEIGLRHYSLKTLKNYSHWTNVFGKFLGYKKPLAVESRDAKAFLEYLALDRKIASSTQNQAFNALVFLYGKVLGRDLVELEDTPRAKQGMNVPEVLSKEEVNLLFRFLEHPYELFFKLAYGCGLRLNEGLNLRIQDIDLQLGILTVHRGKGGKSRKVPLPKRILAALEAHLHEVRTLFVKDGVEGSAGVFTPEALTRKFPGASKEWPWYWVFPGRNLTFVPGSGVFRRNHLHESLVQKAIKESVIKSGISKRASAHTFRHSYATHLLQMGTDIRTVQELMGHDDVKTTMIYLHAVQSLSSGPRSPLDWQ